MDVVNEDMEIVVVKSEEAGIRLSLVVMVVSSTCVQVFLALWAPLTALSVSASELCWVYSDFSLLLLYSDKVADLIALLSNLVVQK